jgi:Sulfotransferase family
MTAGTRRTSPVFVLGSPRSGTTLLYDMLLSAGGFAVYLAESNVFNVLAHRFGDFSKRSNRERLLKAWLGSKLFRATGLARKDIEPKILEECRHPGDFLSIVMGEMVRSQGMQRWAENSPESILHLPTIKRQIPNALVIHIIRDGRDVASSLGKVRYVRPFPWEESQGLIGAGIYWEWIVEYGRIYGRMLGPDYMEVHFEDLLAKPQETLNRIGAFIEQELDYDHIRQVGYGSVSRPNTSFKAETPDAGFNPVGRWKKNFSAAQLFRLECMTGGTLKELGYELSTDASPDKATVFMKGTRHMHRAYFEGKLQFKNSPLVRYLRPQLTSTEMDETMLGEDHPPAIRTVLSQRS